MKILNHHAVHLEHNIVDCLHSNFFLKDKTAFYLLGIFTVQWGRQKPKFLEILSVINSAGCEQGRN